jgi:hypothetical protein
MCNARAVSVLLSLLLSCFVAQASHDSGPPPVVVEAALPFAALPQFADARQYWGTHEGAGFRIEVPANWNGALVMYAHGYRGETGALTVSNPGIRSFLLAKGFAWAASSYYRNHYDVRAGVLSTNALARHFDSVTGLTPKRYFIHGQSMGGHVTVAAIEQYPNRSCPPGRLGRFCREAVEFLGELVGGVKYEGAVPVCGVTGDERLFDYFNDFNLLAQYLAGVEVPRPAPDFATTYLPLIQNNLFVAYPTVNNAQGEKLKAATIELTGGPRPIVALSYPGFMDLLFGFGGGNGSVTNVTHGLPVVSNVGRIYQLDHNLRLSREERELNRNILRVREDRNANPEKLLDLELVPTLSGNLHVPSVSLHTLGDLFVPFSMQQIYAKRTLRWGQSHMLVNRAIRAAQHCEFSGPEQERAFADMLRWVDEGVRPAGDRILNREIVADESFGCQFTTPIRPYDVGGCQPN